MDRAPRAATLVALLLVSAAALMAGCTQQQPLTVRLSDHPTYGTLLTDSAGRSLYVQARDVPNTGAVADLGEVGRFYPPFYAESVVGGGGINISEFGFLTRADGKRQTTYRGWPLYYYINDKAAGDAKSQGANNITFLAKPDYTVMVRENATVGIYLSDTGGAALLVHDGDNATRADPGYAPFRASPVSGPKPLVQAADFAETVGPSGGAQTTYRGQPLYSYSGDDGPGVIAGDGNGYRPVVLAPGGTFTDVVEVTTPAPTPSPNSTVGDGAASLTPVATAQATTAATTGSGYDAYTGGSYTPTPFQTAQISSQGTESATVTSTWTPIVTGTPVPNVSIRTTPPTTTKAPVVNRTTAVRTTTTIKTPATSRPTTLPASVVTTKPTTVPMPITTPPTTVPATSATTLPLPFPITTLLASPAGANQGGNGS